MNFTYRTVAFDVGILPEKNLIVATHIDQDKIRNYIDPNLGNVKAVKYGDLFSVSLPISEISIAEEDKSNIYEALKNKYWNIIVEKLCQKIDERLVH